MAITTETRVLTPMDHAMDALNAVKDGHESLKKIADRLLWTRDGDLRTYARENIYWDTEKESLTVQSSSGKTMLICQYIYELKKVTRAGFQDAIRMDNRETARDLFVKTLKTSIGRNKEAFIRRTAALEYSSEFLDNSFWETICSGKLLDSTIATHLETLLTENPEVESLVGVGAPYFAHKLLGNATLYAVAKIGTQQMNVSRLQEHFGYADRAEEFFSGAGKQVFDMLIHRVRRSLDNKIGKYPITSSDNLYYEAPMVYTLAGFDAAQEHVLGVLKNLDNIDVLGMVSGLLSIPEPITNSDLLTYLGDYAHKLMVMGNIRTDERGIIDLLVRNAPEVFNGRVYGYAQVLNWIGTRGFVDGIYRGSETRCPITNSPLYYGSFDIDLPFEVFVTPNVRTVGTIDIERVIKLSQNAGLLSLLLKNPQLKYDPALIEIMRVEYTYLDSDEDRCKRALEMLDRVVENNQPYIV